MSLENTNSSLDRLNYPKLKLFLRIQSGNFIEKNDFRTRRDSIFSYPVYGGNGLIGFTNKYNVLPDTIVVGRVGALCGNVHLITEKAWVTDNSLVLNILLRDKLKYTFLYYLLKSLNLNQYSQSTAQPLITSKTIKERYFKLPSISDQESVASFISKKTTEIDTLISDKEKLIALLEEKRQAIITEAVTKGLDPDVKMKDSGVEWIGEIPEHWEMRKAKYIFKQINEKNYPEEKLLSVLKGKGLLLRSELEFKAVMAFKGLENFKLVREGDFVIHLRSFQSGFEMSSLQGIVSPAYTVFRASIELDNNYFKYVFYSQYFIDYIGSTTQSLRDGKPIAYDDFSSSYLMFPPEKEQKEISDYLASLCKEMDKAKELIQKQLLKLKEYRQALIYEAVTGKIDVQVMLKETEQEEVSSS